MAWKGFCCFVIYANLHNLPCTCIKMAPMGTFFHFLVIVGIKGEKRTLSTWQNIVWKAFLLFGDSCYSSQFAVYMYQNSSDGNRFTFLVSLGIKVEKKEAWNMAKHGLEGVSVVWWFMLILSNLHNLPCICIKMSPTGTFFTFFLVAGNKVEKRKLGTWHNMAWQAFLLFGDLC